MEVRYCTNTLPGIFGTMRCQGEMFKQADWRKAGWLVTSWKCGSCGHSEEVSDGPASVTGISHAERKPVTVPPPTPALYCYLCGRDGARGRKCTSLSCKACGIWLQGCGDCDCEYCCSGWDGPATLRQVGT